MSGQRGKYIKVVVLSRKQIYVIVVNASLVRKYIKQMFNKSLAFTGLVRKGHQIQYAKCLFKLMSRSINIFSKWFTLMM